MTTFTINNKEYTHKELNLMWDFFTPEQWDIIQEHLTDDNGSYCEQSTALIGATISQLWRSSY